MKRLKKIPEYPKSSLKEHERDRKAYDIAYGVAKKELDPIIRKALQARYCAEISKLVEEKKEDTKSDKMWRCVAAHEAIDFARVIVDTIILSKK